MISFWPKMYRVALYFYLMNSIAWNIYNVELWLLGKGGSCVLYLSMSQSCEEATYFSEHTHCQFPRADLTWAEEQQSKALHCMEHWAVRASLWQSGAGLIDRPEKGGRKVHHEENVSSKQEVVAILLHF